ncbi:MAG: hypothetical protein IH786_01715, partial [Proteobacteria bacterium]|nr:hypothetical protein [Pseudomonadota bacterium]
MLSRNLEQTLHRALALATERTHEYATLQHLLLSLTEDQDSVAVLRACGVDLDQLHQDLTDFIDNELADIGDSRGHEPKPTAGFQRVVQRAVIHVQSSGREEVTGANVLVSLFSERESRAVYFLPLHDVPSHARRDLRDLVAHESSTSHHRQGGGRSDALREFAAGSPAVLPHLRLPALLRA